MPTATPATISSETPTKSVTTRPTTEPTPVPTTLPADYCTAAQLTVRVLPGGAEPSYEIAAVTFTNNSSKPCSLSGYPAVQLWLNSNVLATASQDTANPMTLVHLAPGAQAEAQIRDHSTCQAPLSDSIHVSAPAPLTSLRLESTGPLVQMRGCTVTVDPIVLSS